MDIAIFELLRYFWLIILVLFIFDFFSRFFLLLNNTVPKKIDLNAFYIL